MSAPDAAWFRARGFTFVPSDEFGGRSWRWKGTVFQFSVNADLVADLDLAIVEAHLAKWQRADRDGVCMACGATAPPLSPGGCCAACEAAADALAASFAAGPGDGA